MVKIQRFLIFILLMTGPLWLKGQENLLTFQDVDRQSIELYQKGEWKALISFSKEAFKQGYDYYYLRFRVGIAYFETKKYMKAALNFREALDFNLNDALAGEYLFGCYLELNRSKEAYVVYEKLPPSSREKLRKSLPKLREADFAAGMLSCNQMKQFDSLDLDGEDNIYGETDITQDGNYFFGGLKWGFRNGYDVYGAYSLVKINKNKIAKIGDTLSLDDQYPLKQHQVYLNGNIPLGKGYSILPAFNLVLDRFETVMPKLAPDSITYLFPLEKFSYNNFIGYLSVTKDLNIVQTTLFAAYSTLNEKEQFQAGFQVTYFPFGNLNFYLCSKLMDHINDGAGHIIFDQMAGFRIAGNWWAEADATFGKMQNFHEKSAFVVYNLTDEMKFKGSAKLIYMIGPRWIITAEYMLLLREGNYFYYDLGEDLKVTQVSMTRDFNNQIALIGLKWKF
jgi:hypothetical protein